MFTSKKLAVAVMTAILSGIAVGLVCAAALATFEWASGAVQ